MRKRAIVDIDNPLWIKRLSLIIALLVLVGCIVPTEETVKRELAKIAKETAEGWEKDAKEISQVYSDDEHNKFLGCSYDIHKTDSFVTPFVGVIICTSRIKSHAFDQIYEYTYYYNYSYKGGKWLREGGKEERIAL